MTAEHHLGLIIHSQVVFGTDFKVLHGSCFALIEMFS